MRKRDKLNVSSPSRYANTANRSAFLFIRLLLRRWSLPLSLSLSFRNLLACQPMSRVCHCQSHSNKQSANIDYGIFEKLLWAISSAPSLEISPRGRRRSCSHKQVTHANISSIHVVVVVASSSSMTTTTSGKTAQLPFVDKSDDIFSIGIFLSCRICVSVSIYRS